MTTMDNKIGKNFSRSMGRAKEKILQNLGKVDRTADEIFDEHVNNFNKQQFAATRLQKELNNYIRCIRACSAANKSLLEAVTDVYEPEWGDKEMLSVNSQQVEMLWNDFAHRLAEQVLIPLNTYQGQFPEMRKKIEKRGRKLVDFDGERHALQALQSNPRRAEAKLSRQRENLEAAKRTYEVLNSELHEELPGLYGSRIVFLVSAMSTLFASENIFHSESAKIFQEFEGVVERLAKESAKGTLNYKTSSNAMLNNRADSMKDDNKGERSTPTTPTVKSTKQVVAELGGFDNDNEATTPPHRPPHPNSSPINEPKNHSSSSVIAPSSLSLSPTPDKDQIIKSDPDTINMTNNTTTITSSNTTTPTPPGDVVTTPNKPAMANGVCDEVKTIVVNGDGMHNNNSSMEADTTTATTATATTTETVDTISDKHESNGGHVDVVDDIKHIVEMNTSNANGDKSKLNGNHSPTEVGTSHLEENGGGDGADKLDGHVADDSKDQDKTNSSSITADVVKPTTTARTSTNRNSSTAKENLGSPATKTATESSKEEKGVLYRVRATYRYQKEDEDELSFEAGEIIRVIEYDDPEEQEEGWLMGCKDNGEKGMFPANFTRPI